MEIVYGKYVPIKELADHYKVCTARIRKILAARPEIGRIVYGRGGRVCVDKESFEKIMLKNV